MRGRGRRVVLVVAIACVAGAGLWARRCSQERTGSDAAWERWYPSGSPGRHGRRASSMRQQNGFLAFAARPAGTVLRYRHFPVNSFITTDAILYMFTSLFQGGFTEFENDKLIPSMRKLVDAGLAASAEAHKLRKTQSALAEPALRNLLFFAVAAELFGTQAPPDVRRQASAIAEKIRVAEEAGSYPHEDFTLYKVRGNYTDTAERGNYFRCVKWLSREILPIIPGGDDSLADADIKLRQAVLLGLLMRSDEKLRSTRQEVDSALTYFVGRPDSFTPAQLVDVADRLLPAGYDQGAKPYLATPDALAALRTEFAQLTYPESKIIPMLAGSPASVPKKYVQFLGERYVVDAQIMQETCFPHVSGRLLASGLDVAATLLESDRAEEHLSQDIEQYPDLAGQLAKLRHSFGDLGADDYETFYEGWVGALREALRPPTGLVPEFMQTKAWEDKCLNTALSSWARMRHDFVLYVKQPMTPGCSGRPPLVEPLPRFYDRLQCLAEDLADRGFPGMQDVADLCRDLRVCAEAQIAGEEVPWEKLQTIAIESFYRWLLLHFSVHVARERPAVVVDLMTDSNTLMVLHGATGPLYPIEILIEDDRYPWGCYVGFVMSYHEFTTDQLHRMTDQEWVKLVNKGQHHQHRPDWTNSFIFPAN